MFSVFQYTVIFLKKKSFYTSNRWYVISSTGISDLTRRFPPRTFSSVSTGSVGGSRLVKNSMTS